MCVGTSHTGTGGTCGVSVMVGCHRERACMSRVGMLYKMKMLMDVGESDRGNRRKGKKDSHRRERGRKKRENRTMRRVSSLISKSHYFDNYMAA